LSALLSCAWRMSSTIMSRTFSLPCSKDKRYSARAVAAISGRCSCSAIASTSSSVRPHRPMQSSSVIICAWPAFNAKSFSAGRLRQDDTMRRRHLNGGGNRVVGWGP
jgi:hypothetical protein